MIKYRNAAQRGHAEHGWLDSWHTFSFGGYRDAQWTGYGHLRVINEDRVAPGAGFAPHSHQDMEIISYVLDGRLRHRDSTGAGGVIEHGELQLMSAGRGISHSEMNDSPTALVHFLQIWIVPAERGVPPGYQQRALDADALQRGFAKVAAPAAEAAPFAIHQDARLFVAWPAAGNRLVQPLAAGRKTYLHVARGIVRFAGAELGAGDAAMIEGETALELESVQDSELLLFDLAA